MRRIVVAGLSLFVFCVVIASFAVPPPSLNGAQLQTPTPLTNDDIVKMVQAKLGDDVAIAKIKSSACKFDTSTDALIKLKQEGVSDAVLAAMAGCGANIGSPVSAPAASPPPDPNDPNSPHDSGIYYVRQNPGGRRMTELEPTVYSQGKSGGMFTSAMTYGIKKMKWKAVVSGSRATIRIVESRPTFYFYFEGKGSGLSNVGAFAAFAGASSPNEFILGKMESKKDSREMVVGQVGAFGASTGTRSQDAIAVDFEKVAAGIYKVQPRSDMEPGEYCFFYAATNMAMGQGGGKIFDFGINSAE
jgi:hypothetical protein